MEGCSSLRSWNEAGQSSRSLLQGRAHRCHLRESSRESRPSFVALLSIVSAPKHAELTPASYTLLLVSLASSSLDRRADPSAKPNRSSPRDHHLSSPSRRVSSPPSSARKPAQLTSDPYRFFGDYEGESIGSTPISHSLERDFKFPGAESLNDVGNRADQ